MTKYKIEKYTRVLMKSLEKPQIVHFTVNYRSPEDIQRLVGFWQRQDIVHSGQVLPIVVDNSPTHNPDLATQVATSPVQYVTPNDNLGYIGGPRWAFSRIKNLPWQWLIISNCDLDFADTFYTELGELAGDDIGMVAPQIIGQLSQQDQNPNIINRPSRLKMWWWVKIKSQVPIAQAYHLMSLARDYFKKQLWTQKPSKISAGTSIYAPHGSVLIFHRNYFQHGGDLNLPGFIYGEEIYFAERVRELGLKTKYFPNLRVVHHEHGATGFWPRPLMIRYAHQSLQNIYQLYFT